MPDNKLLCLDCRLPLKCVRENAEMIEYNASGSKSVTTDVWECEVCHAGVVTFRDDAGQPNGQRQAVRDV